MLLKKNFKKGQIAPLMVIVVVVVILAIGATVLVGELGYQKVRLANTVDAGLISSATDLTRSLNLVRQTHFGMLMNHVRLQASMFVPILVWPDKSSAYNHAYNASFGPLSIGIYTSMQMFDKAKEVVAEVPKNMRSAMIERVMSGLIDEPKAYHYKTGTTELDMDRYINETETPFQETYRDYQTAKNAFAGNGYAGKDNWYKNNRAGDSFALSYSWNKTVNQDKSFTKGTLVPAAKPLLLKNGRAYDSYLMMQMNDVPTEIKVKAQPMVLFFLFQCGPSVCPGFFPNPWAWISRVSISPGNSYGLVVQERPFLQFPYFMPKDRLNKLKEVRQMGRIGITGSIWSGYEFKLISPDATKDKYEDMDI